MNEKVTEAKIDIVIPDDRNFNEGTEYGQHLIEESLRKFGAGRSILLDKNNKIIAGNKTVENAANIGLDDMIIVETDGTKIVAVKRKDIDLDSAQGREMALADNATGAANLKWNEEAISEANDTFGIEPEKWIIDAFKKSSENKAEETEILLKPFNDHHILLSYTLDKHPQVIKAIESLMNDSDIEIEMTAN